jgi:hypothetical protein
MSLAEKILEKHLKEMIGRVEESYDSIEEMKKQPEWEATIKAMTEIADNSYDKGFEDAMRKTKELIHNNQDR